MTHSQFQSPAGLRVPGELRADQEAQPVPEMRAKAESDSFPRSGLLRVLVLPQHQKPFGQQDKGGVKQNHRQLPFRVPSPVRDCQA